jgi:hypothetical protein
MSDETRMISKVDATVTLHLAGFSPERIADVLSDLPDPIDLDRDEALLARHGVTLNHLTDSRGGSP